MQEQYESLTVNVGANDLEIYKNGRVIARIKWPATDGDITLPATGEPIKTAVANAIKNKLGKEVVWDELRAATFAPQNMWMYW